MNSFLNNVINRKNIHLDFASATPIDAQVLKEMEPYHSEQFFNPSSSYLEAQNIKKKIKVCRGDIARFFQCRENEVVFTQGGTESNNLAILGIAYQALRTCDFVPHMIFSSIEHPAVDECINELKILGIDVDVVSVSDKGIVNVKEIEKKLNKRTVLVSLIMVSNETGVIQPMHRVSSVIKKFKNKQGRAFSNYPYFHTDASQAVLTQDMAITKISADLVSIDGSKIYAPKMSGILIKKQYVLLTPILHGGGQEFGLRPGTENVVSIVGITSSLARIVADKTKDVVHFEKLKNIFIKAVSENMIPHEINGDRSQSVPNIINICIPGLNSEFAVIQMDELGVNCSAMTACASNKGTPHSQVLFAMGKPGCSRSSLRFSFGRNTTKREIKKAVRILHEVCKRQKLV